MKKHALSDIWNDYHYLRDQNLKKSIHPKIIHRIIAEMFSVGKFYYYVLNIADSTLSHQSENVMDMHGMKKMPSHLNEIIELIHPDDINFVREAERMAIEKILEIGAENVMNLKVSYCFRLKITDGSYQLFHHLGINALTDNRHKLVQSINIHTNIHHLTPVNNYAVLVSGIGERKDFHQMNYKEATIKRIPEKLTAREQEILHYIANGYSSEEISEELSLSHHTIKTHRKNILQKTQTKNSSELIKRCVEWGLI